MLNKRILVLIFVVAFLTLLVGCLPGITPSPPKGVIGGRIMAPPGPETTKDITGWIPLANATVTITDSEGVTHTVTTDEDGYYTFTDIAVNANTIITAAGTVGGNTVIVKDVIPQAVAADEDYEAGIADAESTALALIVEELLKQGVDLGDIDLEEIQASDNFNEVVEQVDSILEENGNVTTDPGLTNTVGNVAEDIINPPEPTPEPTPVFLTSIVVNPKTMTLFVGEIEDIVSVTAHYSNGSTASIPLGSCTYVSNDETIATVVAVLVTAISEGTATITVSYGGKADTVEVTVNPPANLAPTIISSPIITAIMGVEYIYDVEATDPDGDALTYSLTTNPSGMVIDPGTGVISWIPTAVGEEDVTVKVSDGKLSVTQSFKITAGTVELTGIVVLPETMTLFEGESEAIQSVTATYAIKTGFEAPIPLEDCTYLSDNENIATVDINGVVTAKGGGTTTINVSYAGKIDKIVVTVDPILSIVVNPDEMTLAVLGHQSFEVTAYYDNDISADITSECEHITSDFDVAHIVEDGILHYVQSTSLLTGTATITVSYADKTDEIAVTVIESLPPVHNITQGTYYNIIQVAIGDADPGDTIEVAAGTYDEDVTINKSLALVSTEGKDNTTINGQSTGEPGGVHITANNVTFGGDGTGFTVNGSGVAAVYFSQPVSGCIVEGNDIVAASGKNALVTVGGQSNHTIIGNIFSGNPASQLVYVNGQASVSVPSTNVDFIGNTFSGTATGPALGQEATDSTISDNTFATVTGYASLKLWGTGNTVTGNDFTADLPTGGLYVLDNPSTLDIAAVINNNTFLRAVTVEHNPLLPKIWAYIQDAINEAVSGDTINVAAGTYYEHILIDRPLTLQSTDGAESTIIDGVPPFRYLVRIYSSDVTFDGFTVTNPNYVGGSDATGILVGSYLNSEGVINIQILNNTITTVRDGTSGTPSMYGATGINIGRAPIDNVTISGNTISDINNPDGASIDHTCGINVWDGADNILISNNDISDIKYNGILLEYAGNVQVEGNSITECEVGVRGVTVSDLTVNYNNLFGNTEYGVFNDVVDEIDATYNWWGSEYGPKHNGFPANGGDAVSDNVDYEHFLTSEY